MSELTRRAFLVRSSLAAGIGGAVAAVPGLPALLASESPAATTAAESVVPEAEESLPEDVSLAQPLVAHVRDLKSGTIDLYIGNQQISYSDPRLAARLFRAASSG
jgi:hypothetical protein